MPSPTARKWGLSDCIGGLPNSGAHVANYDYIIMLSATNYTLLCQKSNSFPKCLNLEEAFLISPFTQREKIFILEQHTRKEREREKYKTFNSAAFTLRTVIKLNIIFLQLTLFISLLYCG